MQLEHIPEFELSGTTEKEIEHLLGDCFGSSFGGRSYYQQRHHIRILARENGVLLGHMALCFRDVRLDESLFSIWGLAEVATTPSARGKGVATQLLNAAITFVRETPASFFMLFGDRPIYAANGFVAQPNEVTYLTLDGGQTGTVATGADGGLMVLPLRKLSWDSAAKLDILGHKF